MMKMNRRLTGKTEHLKNNGICLTEKLECPVKNLSERVLANPQFFLRVRLTCPLLLLLTAQPGLMPGFLSFFKVPPFNSPLEFSRTDLGLDTVFRFLPDRKANTQALDTFKVLLRITIVFFFHQQGPRASLFSLFALSLISISISVICYHSNVG